MIISTIQRLFSFLKGDVIDDDDEDEGNEPAEEIILPPNPNLPQDRKSTRLNSSHRLESRMPSSA